MDAIDFLPERLNRPPVVFRGLTSAEMFLAFGVGAIAGLLLGIILAIVFGYWALAPTALLVIGFFCVFFSGSWLASKKRGRAAMWLYRVIQRQLTVSPFRSFFHAFGLADCRLVLHESHWSVRRK